MQHRCNVIITHPDGEVIETLELSLDEKPDRLAICACKGTPYHGEQPSPSNAVDYCLIP